MSIPPPPQHPPPRRQPRVEEDPSLTTQIFLDQARAAASGAAEGTHSAGPDVAAAPAGGGAVPPPVAKPPAEPADEETAMLSMDELRAIAQASHIDAIDGPREQEAGASAPRATPQDDAWAGRTAPPSVFTPAVHPGAGQAPHGRTPHRQAAHGLGAGGAVPPPPGAAPPPAVPPFAAGAAQPAPKKRGLPVLAIVFVVLSALIVLGIGGWILADALGRDDTGSQQAAPPPPAPSTSAPDELVEGSEAPPADPDAVAFVTPSGNIGCTIDDERARCIIREFDYGPPAAPDGCTMEDWGSIVVANHEGAGFSCTPADFPTSGQTLDYGESVSAHGMTCESSESGVACRSDESNASFSIARATADFTQK